MLCCFPHVQGFFGVFSEGVRVVSWLGAGVVRDSWSRRACGRCGQTAPQLQTLPQASWQVRCCSQVLQRFCNFPSCFCRLFQGSKGVFCDLALCVFEMVPGW